LALIQSGQAAELLQFLSKMPEDQLAAILAEDNFIWNLAFNGSATGIMTLLDRLKPDQKTRALNATGALESLLKSGQIMPLFELIKTLEHEQQATLLTKPYVIERYFATTKELAGEVFDIIYEMSPEQQTRVLAINYAVKTLADKGLALDIFDIMSHLTPHQQATIRVAKGVDTIMSYGCRRRADRQPPRRQHPNRPAVSESVSDS
jgi:hypothetical protein